MVRSGDQTMNDRWYFSFFLSVLPFEKRIRHPGVCFQKCFRLSEVDKDRLAGGGRRLGSIRGVLDGVNIND